MEADVKAAVECARDEFGRLDCVFNNAGIGGAFGPVTETHVEEWDFSMEVLVRGVFLGLKHGAQVLKRQGEGGVLLSTASVAGLGGGAGSHCYSAAKAAVANLTRSVALEMAPHRVRVNAIAPGMIMTELFHRGRSERGEEFALGRQPWPDPGRPADIAAAAAFLASPDAVFITGQILVVDGGVLAKGPDIFGSGEDSRMLRAAGSRPRHHRRAVDSARRRRPRLVKPAARLPGRRARSAQVRVPFPPRWRPGPGKRAP